MKMELLGSVAILVFLALAVRMPRAWIAAPILTLLLLAAPGGGAQLACFFAGAVFARLRQQGVFQRLNASAGVNLAALAALFILMAVDGFLHTKEWLLWRYPTVAIAIMMAIFSSASAMRAMETRLSQLLGRVSFPLFLVQFPVIVTFTSGAIVALQERQAINLGSAAVVALLSIGVSLAAATAFQPVETFAKSAARILSRAVLRTRSPKLALAPDPELGRAP
jgi:peptidoglycan/LPS O-acetylase OafA/YrhL